MTTMYVIGHVSPDTDSIASAMGYAWFLRERDGSDVLAVVLTGMGNDGLLGCKCIRQAGGQVLAQDEPTSVVWGMPGQVARAGLADDVLPLERIASDILHRVHRRR